MKKFIPLFAIVTFTTVAACSLLPDFGSFGGPSVPKGPPPQTAAGDILNQTTGLLMEFRWWMVLAVLFFPQARTAVGTFIQTMFTAATVPFKLAVDWYQMKKGSQKPPSA